ncbi:MAG: hypothetical protein FD175_1665 [Beijerinckiaceae bacterium]|nr:MAG: hypothetical protein FD175_1665 [Beijerinckiaceae bacterium]
MSIVVSNFALPGAAARRFAILLPAVVVGAGLLAGCSTSNTVSQTEKSVTERILFANTKLPEQKIEESRDYTCPETRILDGTAAYRVGEAGQARGISHQAAINDLARECSFSGGTMRVKVGIQGRLILGDAGKPGTYTIPVRLAVRANGQTVYSKALPTSVVIPPNDTQAAFVVIDDTINVPITAEDPGEAYSILIGLDPQGAKAAPGKKKRQR